MRLSTRKKIKRLVPAILVGPMRRIYTYFMRLGIWFSIMRNIHGVSARDKVILWISFLVSPLTCARSLAEWRDPKLLGAAMLRVRGVGVFSVRGNSDDLWHILPSREQAIVDTINSRLGPGDCFVDAGANMGFYSILAASRVGKSGTVIAVEMMPDTASILRKQINDNGFDQIEVLEKALSDNEGTVTARVTEGQFGQASILATPISGTERLIEVEATTLDSALAKIPEIQLMKLDLEGVEASVLRGAEAVVGRTQALIFEAWQDSHDISSILENHGFAIIKLDGRNNLAVRR